MNRETGVTDIKGIRVGHAQDYEALTGCTVILCEEGAVGGVDVRGGAPGSRETDPLQPIHLVEKVHAVVLSGGSAFGLDSASGVVRYLEERQVGFQTPAGVVPIVPAAILYDLMIGRADIRPDANMGYQACLNASASRPGEGNLGAGCGATVGKILGISQAMKAGFGTAGIAITPDLQVGAIVAVNAFGDVTDPNTDRIIAGALQVGKGSDGQEEITGFANTLEVFKDLAAKGQFPSRPEGNTVIGVVATNARLTKEGANKVAQMAHDGLARTIRPAHTMLDGDTIFALATGETEADVSLVGAFAAVAFAKATLRAVYQAETAGGVPAYRDLPWNQLR